MDRHQGLTDLIKRIYDAALDSSLWKDVLDRTAHYVGGSAAVLISKSPTARGVCLYHEAGADPYYLQLYCDYIDLDPITRGHYFAEIERPLAVADLIPYDEFLGTRFYREWARPQGLVDFVSAVLDKTATDVAMVSVFRHERDGVADDESRRCMQLIAPHIRRAMLIGRAIDLNQAQARTFRDTFDCFGAGAFLLDAGGRMVHANAAGREMLTDAELIRSLDGRLVLADPEADRALREQLCAAERSAGKDIAPKNLTPKNLAPKNLVAKDMALMLSANDGARYVAHVLPLAQEQHRVAGPRAAVAAMFVRRASLEASLRPDVIARTYRLTPAELRVLLAILEAGGVREVSEALGVAETTIKTHLSRLFEKTGAGRQADLIKLVAGLALPLAG